MARKDDYVTTLEAQIEQWSARMDELTAKAQKLNDDARRSALHEGPCPQDHRKRQV
jgi:uncharacterized coiled-coil protein SlyX